MACERTQRTQSQSSPKSAPAPSQCHPYMLTILHPHHYAHLIDLPTSRRTTNTQQPAKTPLLAIQIKEPSRAKRRAPAGRPARSHQSAPTQRQQRGGGEPRPPRPHVAGPQHHAHEAAGRRLGHQLRRRCDHLRQRLQDRRAARHDRVARACRVPVAAVLWRVLGRDGVVLGVRMGEG